MCFIPFHCIDIFAIGPQKSKHSDQIKMRHIEVVFKRHTGQKQDPAGDEQR